MRFFMVHNSNLHKIFLGQRHDQNAARQRAKNLCQRKLFAIMRSTHIAAAVHMVYKKRKRNRNRAKEYTSGRSSLGANGGGGEFSPSLWGNKFSLSINYKREGKRERPTKK